MKIRKIINYHIQIRLFISYQIVHIKLIVNAGKLGVKIFLNFGRCVKLI